MIAYIMYLFFVSLLREASSTGSIVGKLSVTPPDISNHRNFHLLPKDCGIVKSQNELTEVREANLFEFPWMALIGRVTGPDDDVFYEWVGTVIAQKFILTLATATNKSESRAVRLGEYNGTLDTYCVPTSKGSLTCKSAWQDISVEESIVHPNYDTKTFENDIALLRLASNIEYNDAVNPICLPITRTAINSPLTIALWFLEDDAMLPYSTDTMYKTKVDYITPTFCKSLLTMFKYYSFEEKRLCARYKGNSYGCLGLGGTPVLSLIKVGNKVKQKYVQIGLQSFRLHSKCDTLDNPYIYTNVAEYMDWILDNFE